MRMRPLTIGILAVALACVATAGARMGAQAAPAALTMTGTAFGSGDVLPKDYTADRKNVSPPLAWTGALNGLSGFNAFQRAGQPPTEPGYRGPAPPPGAPHHYRFTVYALNAPLDVKEELDKTALLKAMDGSIAAQGEVVGIYERTRP